MENVAFHINNTEKEKYSIFEEDVLRQASIYAEEKKITETDPEKIRIIVKKIEDSPIYESYLKRKFAVEKLLEKISEIRANYNNEEINIFLDFLEEQYCDLKELNHRYNKFVRGYEKSMKIQNFRLDPEKKREKTEKYDKGRKDCHNSILSIFTATNRHLKETIPQKFNIDTNYDFLFTTEDIADRDYIGDWSRLTATGEELEEYKKALLSNIQEKEAQ